MVQPPNERRASCTNLGLGNEAKRSLTYAKIAHRKQLLYRLILQ